MNRTIKFRAWLDGEHKEYGGSTLKAEPHMEYDVLDYLKSLSEQLTEV